MAHPAMTLLRKLFATAPGHEFVELRPVPLSGLSLDRRFLRADLLKRNWDRLPYHLDGRADCYFGALTRIRQRGKASDVGVATFLWVDLDHGFPDPWPTKIPFPNTTVETSPSRYQCYWLLEQPCSNLEVIKSVEKRLAYALGGDLAATDLARVLRLPGYKNLKYPDKPVARIVEMRNEDL